MKTVLRATGLLIGVIAVVVAAVAVVARFSDGPIGPFAGGPLVEGELVEEPVVDWSFAADVDTVELQLEHPPRSRTVWILVHDGLPYIGCGLPGFSLWKQWPHEALRDGRAILRVGGRRYRRHAVRVTDPELIAELGEIAKRKYDVPDTVIGGGIETWYFRLDPASGD